MASAIPVLCSSNYSQLYYFNEGNRPTAIGPRHYCRRRCRCHQCLIFLICVVVANIVIVCSHPSAQGFEPVESFGQLMITFAGRRREHRQPPERSSAYYIRKQPTTYGSSLIPMLSLIETSAYPQSIHELVHFRGRDANNPAPPLEYYRPAPPICLKADDG